MLFLVMSGLYIYLYSIVYINYIYIYNRTHFVDAIVTVINAAILLSCCCHDCYCTARLRYYHLYYRHIDTNRRSSTCPPLLSHVFPLFFFFFFSFFLSFLFLFFFFFFFLFFFFFYYRIRLDDAMTLSVISLRYRHVRAVFAVLLFARNFVGSPTSELLLS